MNATGASGRSPAGFWKRYLAYSIDIALVSVLVQIVVLLVPAGSGQMDLEALLQQQTAGIGQGVIPDPSLMMAQMASALLQALEFSVTATVLIAAVYFIGMECSPRQATLGKRLVGIKVTDRRGARIGPARAAARFAAGALSWLTLNLGHALAAWTPEKRALHDYVADTYVDNADPANPGMPPWGWLVIGLQGLLLLLATVAIAVMLASALATFGGL